MPRHPADHVPTEFGSFAINPGLPIVPQLYAALRGKILTLKLKPGDAISESELALACGVSRTPARQVIKQLVDENLLVVFASRGTYVSKIDSARLKDALLIRRRLEPVLARECALVPERASLVDNLKDLLQQQDDALTEGIVDRAYKIDAAFHEAIAARVSEGLIWQTIRQARTEADRLHALSRNRADSLQNALQEHHNVVACIEAGYASESFISMERHMATNEEAFENILREHPDLFLKQD